MLSPTALPKPLQVVQVFARNRIWTKADRDANSRRQEMPWPTCNSTNGGLNSEGLMLPQDVLQAIHTRSSGVHFIVDRADGAPHEEQASFSGVGPMALFIFEARATDDDDAMELHLRYDRHRVGLPERDDHLLAQLRPGKAVEVRINGKLDHSLSAGMQRTYQEQHYVFQHLGTFKECRRQPAGRTHAKEVPAARKVVDLCKLLW